MDVDRLYNIPMNKIIKPDTKILLPFTYDMTFTSDFFCAAPGNMVFRRALDVYFCMMREQAGMGLLQWSKLNGEQRHIVTTEAMGTFYASAMDVVFGRPVWGPREHGIEGEEGDNIGRAFADHVRKSLAENPYIVTHREVWCDLIVSNHPKCEWITKQELFAKAKLAQWDAKDAGAEIKKEPGAGITNLEAVVNRTETKGGDGKQRKRRRRFGRKAKSAL